MSEIGVLQARIAEVDEKISALERAKASVSSVDINIDSQMPGIEGLHVAGSKYDEQRDKEVDTIDEGKNTLKKNYKDLTIQTLEGEIGTLRQMKANLHVQLTAAIAREQARQAQEQRRIAEAMKKRSKS
ncbi:hypothetical protein [Streptococcus cristatus]|uniref:DUF5082 domain-containing protein n=1 Tax=Streptococcus cristatus TaxID=45634 RepID=A0A139N5Z6_STRCR|nr:hypothetical protein [Streptococcus cristatus]KXT71151.1 hypothetical protein SCRDD08_00165 [Streptococcus cristatus]